MAHYFLFAKKDSTIYEDSIHMNTGLDQLVELQKQIVHSYDDAPYNSRILIEFDLDDYSSSFASGELSGSGMKFYLNMYTAEALEIPFSYTVCAYPVSQSWEMGDGKRSSVPATKTGVSWEVRDGVTISGITGSTWVTTGSDYLSGSGYETYESSQSFEFQTTDLYIDVTNTVLAWLRGTIPNYGFLIRRTVTDERNDLNQGTIRFYSNETNTIYRPRLEAIWKDFSNSPRTTVSYSYSEATSILSMSYNPVISYTTVTSYTGSGIGYNTGYFTQSADSTTWYKESYYYATHSIYSWTGSVGLYHSSSFVTSSTYLEYTYTSGSNTIISYSLVSTTTTLTDFYTASLGSDFSASNVANVSYSIAAATSSDAEWTYASVGGYYYSQSFTAVTANYTYLSSSITGYATSSASTQTMFAIGGEDFVIHLTNMLDKYRQDSKVRFRMRARERYPKKTYTTGSWSYTRDESFLPLTSYYSIRDAWTEEEVIPFSDYSQISVDSTGSYFNLYLNGVEPERFYRILFKVSQSNNVETIYDEKYTFKVIR